MRVAQKLYRAGKFIEEGGDQLTGEGNVLVLGFGSKNILMDGVYSSLEADYPRADILLCSTAGEIYDDLVFDDTLSLTIIEFEKTSIKTVSINIGDFATDFEAGKAIFSRLKGEELQYVMVLCDGSRVNASQLVKGIGAVNTGNIPVTGGLAGDADKFNFTLVGCNRQPEEGNIVAVGFYGKSLKIGHSSQGGWEIFGPEKKVTRSSANCLYEIDNKNALSIYKQYLGKYADELPRSAFLFPLYVRPEGSSNSVVRTILSINDNDQSMVFAGDIPEGAYIRFMKANFDKLVDAAVSAADNTVTLFPQNELGKPKLALLISCVGRKIILGKRIDEEIEAVKERLGNRTIISGFYSYGEISPLNPNSNCELHNQSMTITTFNEEL
jgi:hypothetical protein